MCEKTEEENEDMGEMITCAGCDLNFCDLCEELTTFDEDWHNGILMNDKYWCEACYEEEEEERNFAKSSQNKCEHKYECGCEKSICDECREQLKENDVPKEEWGTYDDMDCECEGCKFYYTSRNDNCNCGGRDCGYCEERYNKN